jgi:hypothetical protein
MSCHYYSPLCDNHDTHFTDFMFMLILDQSGIPEENHRQRASNW